MRAVVAIAGREVAERARLLPLALLAGVLPLALPYLGWRAAEEVRHVLAAVAAFAVTTATALLAGGSVIGRDLSERRLGFFFARPVGSGALWAGKMFGAILLTLVTLVLSSISLAWLGLPPAIRAHAPEAAAIAGLALLALIGLAHAVSVGYRSRSPWFALDLMLAAATGLWVADLVTRWLGYLGEPPVVGLLAWAAFAVTAAGAAQLAVGRVDALRGHRALSLVLWVAVLLGVAAFEARTRWLLRPQLRDLLSADVAYAAPRGDWVTVVGPARGRGRGHWAFLAEAGTGRAVRLGPAYGGALVFSPDGRRAAWVTVDGPRFSAADLSFVDLDRETLHPQTRPLPGRPDVPTPVALSPDGRRLLTLERHAVVVADLEGAGPPLRIALPEGYTRQATFPDVGRARLFHGVPRKGTEGALRILDLDVATGALTEVARLRTRGNAWVHVSPAGERFILTDRPDRQPSLTLHAADGAPMAVLVAPGAGHDVQGDFLADGRIAVVQRAPAPRLRLFSPAGAEERAVDLGGTSLRVVLGGEVAPGRLVVGLGGPAGYEAEAVLVDVVSGQILRRERGLVPAVIRWFPRDAGSWSRPTPGSAAASLFRDANGAVLRVDLATGAREAVFPSAGTGRSTDARTILRER